MSDTDHEKVVEAYEKSTTEPLENRVRRLYDIWGRSERSQIRDKINQGVTTDVHWRTGSSEIAQLAGLHAVALSEAILDALDAETAEEYAAAEAIRPHRGDVVEVGESREVHDVLDDARIGSVWAKSRVTGHTYTVKNTNCTIILRAADHDGADDSEEEGAA